MTVLMNIKYFDCYSVKRVLMLNVVKLHSQKTMPLANDSPEKDWKMSFSVSAFSSVFTGKLFQLFSVFGVKNTEKLKNKTLE